MHRMACENGGGSLVKALKEKGGPKTKFTPTSLYVIGIKNTIREVLVQK